MLLVIGLVCLSFCGSGLAQNVINDEVDVRIYTGKVAVQHDFLVALALESIYFGEFLVEGFFLLNLRHVKIGFAKMLRRLKVCKT